MSIFLHDLFLLRSDKTCYFIFQYFQFDSGLKLVLPDQHSLILITVYNMYIKFSIDTRRYLISIQLSFFFLYSNVGNRHCSSWNLIVLSFYCFDKLTEDENEKNKKIRDKNKRKDNKKIKNKKKANKTNKNKSLK